MTKHTYNPYRPKTGAKCACKRGQERDNCPQCEGTGQVIDFKAIRAMPLEKGDTVTCKKHGCLLDYDPAIPGDVCSRCLAEVRNKKGWVHENRSMRVLGKLCKKRGGY